jgi:hypothetical protein
MARRHHERALVEAQRVRAETWTALSGCFVANANARRLLGMTYFFTPDETKSGSDIALSWLSNDEIQGLI